MCLLRVTAPTVRIGVRVCRDIFDLIPHYCFIRDFNLQALVIRRSCLVLLKTCTSPERLSIHDALELRFGRGLAARAAEDSLVQQRQEPVALVLVSDIFPDPHFKIIFKFRVRRKRLEAHSHGLPPFELGLGPRVVGKLLDHLAKYLISERRLLQSFGHQLAQEQFGKVVLPVSHKT